MSDKLTIVAVNGSPHAGIGNTSMMIEMLRVPLSEEGLKLDVIPLAVYEIEYCTGCGFCMEKGKCWIDDDHHKIVEKLLAADGIILGSPVYVFHVTGQMKTFLDRSLAFGHKPRPTWKPGLAISVSAGLGETQTAEYLAAVLRIFGAFSVGRLTAMAVAPGEFVGREAVEARARDLAHDLVRSIKEKRRYPATDWDLRFYQFMGNLVKNYKDTVMKHDYKHWQEHGFYDGFEAYIQQTTTKVFDDARMKMREEWVKEMIAQHKAKKKGQLTEARKESAGAGPKTAKSCKELLQMMPLGLNPTAAAGLTAVYQFEVSGDENFVAHLQIADGVCIFREEPAVHPSVVIKTPADVWLAVAKGEMDGQQAFMNGRYKVEGDLSLLLKLRALFSR
jgi:multimeric flavodoxin WrbA